nr:ATP-binding protein [Actinomadura sp. CNU-125]
MFEDVTAHLLAVAARTPVVITLDDLQWCDPPSLRWLAYLAHRSADLPIGIVVACSLGEMGERRFLVDELIALFERRTLGALAPAQLRAWIADALGARPDDAFVAGCHRVTGGSRRCWPRSCPRWPRGPRRRCGRRCRRCSASGPRRGVPARPAVDPARRPGRAGRRAGRRGARRGRRAGPRRRTGRARTRRRGTRRRPVDQAAHPVRHRTAAVRPPARPVGGAGRDVGRAAHLAAAARGPARSARTAPRRSGRRRTCCTTCAASVGARDALRAAAASARQRGDAREALGYLRRALAEPMPVADRAELLADIGAAEIGAGLGGAAGRRCGRRSTWPPTRRCGCGSGSIWPSSTPPPRVPSTPRCGSSTRPGRGCRPSAATWSPRPSSASSSPTRPPRAPTSSTTGGCRGCESWRLATPG